MPKIEPYYQENGITLYLGDCMDIMKTIPDKSIDLCLCDPPYGIGADTMQMGSGEHKWDKSIRGWDNITPSKEVFDLMLKVSDNQIIWGGNYFTDKLPITENWIVWDKCNPNLSFSEAELAYVKNGRKIRIAKDYSAKTKKVHPTQKSLKLMKLCVRDYSKPNNTILDSFLGSGTTLVACKELGRKGIGIEISKEYCDIAVKRLKNTVKDMFL